MSRRSLPFKTASCRHFSSSLARLPYPGSSRRSPSCFFASLAYLVPPSHDFPFLAPSFSFLRTLRGTGAPALSLLSLLSLAPSHVTSSNLLATLTPTGRVPLLPSSLPRSSTKSRWRNLGDQISRGRNLYTQDFRDFHSGLVSRTRTTYNVVPCHSRRCYAETMAGWRRWKAYPERTMEGPIEFEMAGRWPRVDPSVYFVSVKT